MTWADDPEGLVEGMPSTVPEWVGFVCTIGALACGIVGVVLPFVL